MWQRRDKQPVEETAEDEDDQDEDNKNHISKCNSVQKPHSILPTTPEDLSSASKYFQMLPDPPGAKQSALRLGNSILRCFLMHLKLWRWIQDALSRRVKFWSS
jgi:hypothetical protein